MALTVPTMGAGSYSGFWNNTGPAGPSGAGPYALKYARAGELQRASVPLSKRGFRRYRAILNALIGAAPGGTATDSYVRVLGVQGDSQFNGGQRSMQTVNQDTVTTAAHVTALQQRLASRWTKPTRTYPRDLSGNGGGGKRGR